MAFLVPAIAAGVSDALILYLSVTYTATATSEMEEEHKVILSVSYLPILAIIRLLLLFFPLPYHSYIGTAVKWPWLYHVFYAVSATAVLAQMLAVIMLDPDSLTSFLPSDYRQLEDSREHALRMRHVWLELSLSLLSTIMHVLLLFHVRSTAPSPYRSEKYAAKRVLYYYAQQQKQEDSGRGDADNDRETEILLQNSSSRHGNDLIEQMKLIPEGYDDFMFDLQSRLHRAKIQWSSRLEEFSKKVTSSSSHGSRGTLHYQQTSNAPFRVLLQLFAYKEVLANGRLNRAFNVDGGESMTFYVPQLLSFLLHGAYDCSPQLEKWILEHCRQNIHFAHRCFWFLRSWCLQVPAVASMTPQSSESLSRRHSEASLDRRSISSSWSENSSRLHGLDSPLVESQSRRPSKYHPEERTLIEGLMLRVMECGEIPARILQYGTGERDDDNGDVHFGKMGSPSALMAATESGLIPVDPNYGIPSMRHMDSVTATRLHGFLPLHDQAERQPLSPGGCFMSTPRFLDALTALADNLMLIPRERRLEELRRQLRLLEVEFLPSNDIYIPLGNVYHGVWRIVADESIAISTKERVPCIIYLEVVNYTARHSPTEPVMHQVSMDESVSSQESLPEQQPTTKTGGSSKKHTPSWRSNLERENIHLWKTARRDPHRHDTLLDKVTNFTHNRLKMLRDQHNDSDGFIWIHQDAAEEEAQQDTGKVDLEKGLTPAGGASGEEEASRDRPPLAPTDAPRTPPGSMEAPHSLTEMGQWSSPTPGSSPTKQGPNLGRMRAVRMADGDNDPERVMDALVEIRSSMEQFQRQDSGSLHEWTSTRGSTAGEATASSSKKRRRPPPVVFKESFASKQERMRSKSAYGNHPGWRLLPILIKSNDDLRQEQLASQLIYRMASILVRERVPVWLCPYEIVALTDSGGAIEAIPDTISIDSLKRNSPNFATLGNFFIEHFGEKGSDEHADAKACFVESLAAYSMVCFLLQIKDRHNGNILLDNRGHLIHIDFGFFFLSSPGKNSGFESAPFKLTRDFVDLMNGPDSNTFRTFRDLTRRTFLALRKHCDQITLLVEMLMVGNEDLPCFRGRPEDAVKGLRERFRLDLNDRACTEYVNALVDESLENWRTRWYDRYQRYCVGVL